MFLKRLFCKKHEWKKIDYEELKDDTNRVIFRATMYQCKKCGKKNTYNHPMQSDYYK